jgi:hypothetical protein
MKRSHVLGWLVCGAFVLFAAPRLAYGMQIGGTISTTLVIHEDSEFVDDVTCTVTGAPCISFGASGISLKLNGFVLTGLGDPDTGCGGTALPAEFGIDVNGQRDVIIKGPGLVQRFRNQGIRLLNSVGSKVTGLMVSTNCSSGIIVIGGSENALTDNISIRNGNGGAPCGGI